MKLKGLKIQTMLQNIDEIILDYHRCIGPCVFLDVIECLREEIILVVDYKDTSGNNKSIITIKVIDDNLNIFYIPRKR